MTATEYNKLNELLSQYSMITAALELAESEIKTVQLAAAQELLPKHAAAKVSLANLEAQIHSLSDRLYSELFPDDKRTHKTPFGEIAYHKSTSLEYDDADEVALRIDRACDEEEAFADSEKREPLFKAEQLLRTKIAPNLEALEALPDAVLRLFGVRRAQNENFKIKPFAMKTSKPAKKPEADKA